jgi:hypothetical protein
MNDLDLIRDLTPEAPLPGPADLAGARSRLAAAIAAERAGSRASDSRASELSTPRTGRAWRAGGRPRQASALGRRTPVARPARRLALTATATAAVAAVITVLIVLPGRSASAPKASRPVRPTPAAAATPGPQQTVDVAAARFLQRAAAAVRVRSASVPGPDQFVYTENVDGGGRVERMWLSTNGNLPGLHKIWNGSRLIYDKVVPPCTVAQAEQVVRTDGEADGDCGVEAGYLAGMPTDPHKLLAYLAAIDVINSADADPGFPASMGPGWLANDLGKGIEETMPYIYLLPAQWAGLYQLMAETPGFTIVHEIRDPAGRTGVGIACDGGGMIIIFNAKTYAFMGVFQAEALTQIAFVSKAGQLP